MNHSETSSFSEFFSGVWDEFPILVGVMPFGLIFAILAREAGLSSTETQGMSLIVFAGSSQFLLVQLAEINAPVIVMVLTGFIINLRHLLYSASIAPYTKDLSIFWKLVLSYLLTDEAYAVTIAKFQNYYKQKKHWYFFGAGMALWSSWQISTWLGLVIGTQIPANWSLDFALPLTFIALAVPMIKDRPGLFAALTSGIVAVLTVNLPY
jgi:4-azaleucine resistance transporter AzlC